MNVHRKTFVVAASFNPEIWECDPFKLAVEGDKLHGRGTTDCYM